jgi:methyl-accepting chemotaxis protein
MNGDYKMFNSRLKEHLKAAEDELAMHKLMLHGLTAKTMALTIDDNFLIIDANEKISLDVSLFHQRHRSLTQRNSPSIRRESSVLQNLRVVIDKHHSVSDNYPFLHADGSLIWVRGSW